MTGMGAPGLDGDAGAFAEARSARGGATLPLIRAWFLPTTLSQLWAFTALAGIFVALAIALVRPHDFWWHVRAGQWIVDNGRVPATDPFSYTRPGELYGFALWWLMEVALYLLLRVGGLPLVILANALVITAAYGLLLRISQWAASGNLRWAALATLAAAVVGMGNWNVRPQTASILIFALTLYLLERRVQSLEARGTAAKSLWWLVPLFALWANSHGAFVLGLALVSVHLLAALLAWLRRQRPFPTHEALVSLACGAATLLNPLGPGIVNNVLRLFRHSAVRYLTLEWQPPTLQTPGGKLFFGLVLALIALLLASRYRPAPREWLRLLLFGGLALQASRNAIWFGFVAAPTMAAALQHWSARRGFEGDTRAGRRGINLAFASLVVLLALLSLPWFRRYLPLPEGRRGYLHPETPVEAVSFLRGLSPPPRVFQPDAYGSYMIWASPEIPVFADTRIDFYPLEQWQDYIAVHQARYDWQAILARYGVDTLFLEQATMEPLIAAATASPAWERIYGDDRAVIFQQRGTR